MLGEMPPKRGRGRGRGAPPPVRSPENTPPKQESSQIGQRRKGHGRGKSERTVSSFEEFHTGYNTYPNKESRDQTSQPSTSGSVKQYKRDRVGTEDTELKFKDESHRSYHIEKSREYARRSTSATKENRKPPEDKSKLKIKQDESHRYANSPERSRYEPSTSSKEYRKKYKSEDTFKTKQDESRRHTFTAERSHDYQSSSVPSASEKCLKRQLSPEDVGFKFKQKSSEMSPFPMRPGLGKEGRHIKVISNLYPIKFPTGYAYHYDVEVFNTDKRKQDTKDKKYRCLNAKRNREVILYMLRNNPDFKRVCGAFDGKKNLLIREKLKIDLPFSCNVMLPSEERGDSQYDSFKVEIKALVSKINLDTIDAFYSRRSNELPQDAIMAIEIILRHSPCLKFTPVGRSFFFPPDVGSITPFGGGLEIWYGYHQSIRLSQWSPTVNLDTSATTFWKAGPMLDYIADCMDMSVNDLFKLRNLHERQIRRINHKLENMRVKVTHLSYGRKYRILKLRNISANKEYIQLTNKRNDNVTQKTVVQYFKDTYNIDLQFGHLPCIQVQPIQKNIYIPIEVCEIVQGQHYKGEITQEQKTKMIQSTSSPPHERFKKIQDILHKKADFNNDKTVKSFGLEVSDRNLIAEARVLDSPSLMYKHKFHSEKKISPQNGQWDVRDTQFFQAAKISKWVLLSFRQDRNLKDFAKVLMDVGRNLGLQIGMPSDILIENKNCDKEKLLHSLKKENIDLVVIVIPILEDDEGKWLYADIKKAAETVIGLATQCVKEERLKDMQRKRWPQIANNLCLKINAKLGGENHSLLERDIPKILCKPVIIIGADVNHPPPTKLDQPSIAACVGSLDCIGKRYAVSIRLQVNSSPQKKKVEQILELEDMVRDLLVQFYRHTRRKKPEKIIFFRDGVSEGELLAVKKEEIASIRRACQKLDKEYKPGITVIVVQKRHHVRFKPYKREDGAGPKGNLPPGTVIETEVTHPIHFDFFLCSQFGLQGTSRPSHYLVIEDDSKFTADDLQKLIYQMCHMSVRCTKTISIPAPVAYADLVAYRARKHLECKRAEDYNATHRFSQKDIDAIQVVDNLKDSMYFV